MKGVFLKIGGAALLLAGIVIWVCFSDAETSAVAVKDDRKPRSSIAAGDGAAESSKPDRGEKRKGKRLRVKSPMKTVQDGKLKFGQWRDEFGENDKEIVNLCQKIVKELQDALDSNDRTKVLLVIAKFRAPLNQGGLDGNVPKELRSQAVEALGWFGSASVTDLMEFMADPDTDVSEDAFAKFEAALDDWDMGDRERSKILQEVAKLLTDTERIDSLMFNLNNMRNSVKAETVAGILANGSAEAKALMADQIEFYLDMDVEPTEAGVAQWQQANPDDATDEEFYGPQQSE